MTLVARERQFDHRKSESDPDVPEASIELANAPQMGLPNAFSSSHNPFR